MDSNKYITSILRRHEEILTAYTGIPVEEKPSGWEPIRKRLMKGDIQAPRNADEHKRLQYARSHLRATQLINATARAYRSGKLSERNEIRKREILIAWHGPIVVKVARKYSHQLEIEELMTAALMGVTSALDLFDAEKYDWGFGSRGYILTTIERRIWKEIREFQKRNSPTVSIDAEESPEIDSGEDPSRPEDISSLLATLEEDEKLLISKIYGIGVCPINYKDIAKNMGISRQRVHQIAAGILKTLRDRLWKDEGVQGMKWNAKALASVISELKKIQYTQDHFKFDQ